MAPSPSAYAASSSTSELAPVNSGGNLSSVIRSPLLLIISPARDRPNGNPKGRPKGSRNKCNEMFLRKNTETRLWR